MWTSLFAGTKAFLLPILFTHTPQWNTQHLWWCGVVFLFMAMVVCTLCQKARAWMQKRTSMCWTNLSWPSPTSMGVQFFSKIPHLTIQLSLWTNGWNLSIQLLDWPGNSPHLYPIENLWMLIKKRVSAKSCSSLGDLQNAIQTVWCTEFSAELCQNMAKSMPKQISAVLKNIGYPTEYSYY